MPFGVQAAVNVVTTVPACIFTEDVESESQAATKARQKDSESKGKNHSKQERPTASRKMLSIERSSTKRATKRAALWHLLVSKQGAKYGYQSIV